MIMNVEQISATAGGASDRDHSEPREEEEEVEMEEEEKIETETPVATVTSGAVPVSVGSPLPESAVEKIAKAHELKQEGNSLFKAGQLRRAMRKYHHGLLYVKGVVNQVPGLPAVERLVRVKASPAEEEEANELIGALSNNLAACLLKAQEWDKALTHTNKVLELNPSNAKALFRRGVANMNLNNFEEAESDLQDAEGLDPKDASIKRQLQLLRQKRQDYEKTEQRLYSAMFQAS